MRLIHLGDLHLGKFVLEVSMLEEQRAFLRYLADYAAANAVDAVLLAGDIYDRSVPPAEAVQVLDEFWCALHRAGIPVLAVPGNHDSPERLAFGSRLFASEGIHMAGPYDGTLPVVELRDAYGPVRVYLLPFLKPVMVRAALGEDVATTDEAVRAFRLFDQIQRYPKIHNWEPRMREMICAQIALIGIKLYERMQKIDIGYKIGMESLELLRQQSSQRYAYPLLAELVRIGIMLEKEKSEELMQFQKFQKAFEIVYEENKIPYMRVWQCGSIENSYDVGMVLKRMRMAQEKTQEEVCIDEKGFSFLNVRQLSRIEKGENRPSTENFQFLTRKMGRELDWIMPMLETDSIEVLSMRQDIIYAIGMRQWKKAQNILEQLKTKIGAEDYKEPQIQQEIQFIEAMYELEANRITACEAEKEYYEALSYTFELSWLSLEELPFIRSEEGIIISNIADIYHDMGNLKKSEELFEKLSSVYQKKQIFLKINSSASAIILGQYSRLLGDIMNYEKALYIDSVNLKYELNDFNLIHIENLLYNQAWAYYEIDREQNNQKIQRKFWAAQRFAEFNRKEELINLLKMRENKYLKDD